MRVFKVLSIVLLVAAMPVVADNAFEPASAGGGTVAPDPGAPVWAGPRAVLWDNGPLVTHPAGGAGGADASAVQTASLMSLYGFGFQSTVPNRMADDFTVTDAGGWQIDEIVFFGYQTGSSTTSTFTDVYVQIWDGAPNAGGTVVWGDYTTNRLSTTAWTNIYRVLDTTLTDSNRPIMSLVATVGTVLPQGTYWVEYMAAGVWRQRTVGAANLDPRHDRNR